MLINGIPPVPPVGQVPILGQPVVVVGWVPIVMAVCKCKGVPLMIVGVEAVSKCPQCGNSYRIEAIDMNRQINTASITVGTTMPRNSPPRVEP